MGILSNMWDTITANMFAGRTVTGESSVKGVVFDDGLGYDQTLYTDINDRSISEKYDRMRRMDPQIRALTRNTKLPVMAGTYSIESNDDDVREFCERQIGLSADENNIKFEPFLRDALSMMDFGFSAFEYSTALVNGLKEVTGIYIRPAKSVDSFIVDKRHRVIGINQDTMTRGLVRIDKNVFVISFETEGSRPQGQSLLESCVSLYDLKQDLLTYTRQAAKRYATGIPFMSLETDDDGNSLATPEEKEGAYGLLDDYADGKIMSFMLPDTIEMSVLGMESRTAFDTLSYLKYIDLQMAKAYLSQMLELGSTATGSRAVSDTFADNFYNGLFAVANHVCDSVTENLLSDLVQYNFGNNVKAKLVVSDIFPENASEILEHIHKFSESGIIQLDPGQKQHVVEMMNLPGGLDQEDDRDRQMDMPTDQSDRGEMA